MKTTGKKTLGERINALLTRTIRFITYDIWRITENEVSGLKELYINVIKTIILAVRGFQDENLQTKASALTYSTLLSMVPLLAVLLGIAKGFGLQNTVRQALFDYFPGHEAELTKAFEFVESYLVQAQGGIIIGVGLITLFYTAVNLISSIEDTFNDIWQIKHGRPYVRQFTDYLALLVVAPVFLICNAGISLLLATAAGQEHILGWALAPVVRAIPYLVIILLFVLLYMYLPNTKVRFGSALFAGLFTGIAFQIFQVLYISGQIWISKYNAIYGSFAALPLLLLWLQLSWFICLFGAELAFAHQNVSKFDFEQEARHISRRYRDFILLAVMRVIVGRFATGERPYTADQISGHYRIPTRLTADTLELLLRIGLVAETPVEDDKVVSAYIPASDIHRMTVADLFERVDRCGSENFRVDLKQDFSREWDEIIRLRDAVSRSGEGVLIRDL